jgi:hypothetical protein
VLPDWQRALRATTLCGWRIIKNRDKQMLHPAEPPAEWASLNAVVILFQKT